MTNPSIHTTTPATPTFAQEVADAFIEGLALAIDRYGSDDTDEGSRLYRATMASALVDIWPHGSEAQTAPGEDDLSLSDAMNTAWEKTGAADAVLLAFPTTVQF